MATKKRKQNENLIPGAHRLTVEEQSRGGIASGESRRAKGKTARELARRINDSLIDPKNKKMKDSLLKMGLEEGELTNAALLVGALFAQAAQGDIRAYEKWLDLVGETRSVKESNDKLDALIEAVKKA